MKVNYNTKNNRMTVQFETEGHSGLWAQLAAFQEVFEENECGKCKSDNLKFVVRKATDESGKKEYKYHELRCRKCGAKKAFGVIDDGMGSLFPKIKDGSGAYLNNNGWLKFNKETGKEE